MNKLRMIIRLHSQGHGLKKISRLGMTSRNTVKKYLKRWHELSMSYESFSGKSDEELYGLFMSVPSEEASLPARREVLEKLLPDYVKRLSKKDVTRRQLHREYLSTHPGGYGIASSGRFCCPTHRGVIR